jgi:hypothetical protein
VPRSAVQCSAARRGPPPLALILGCSFQGKPAHSVALRPRVTLVHEALTHALRRRPGACWGLRVALCMRPRVGLRVRQAPLPANSGLQAHGGGRRSIILRAVADGASSNALDSERADAGQRQLAGPGGCDRVPRLDAAGLLGQGRELRRSAAGRAGTAQGEAKWVCWTMRC